MALERHALLVDHIQAESYLIERNWILNLKENGYVLQHQQDVHRDQVFVARAGGGLQHQDDEIPQELLELWIVLELITARIFNVSLRLLLQKTRWQFNQWCCTLISLLIHFSFILAWASWQFLTHVDWT